MKFIFYLTCLAITGTIAAYNLSENLRQFYCVFNGIYSNKDQVESDATNRTLMAEIVRYLYIPALSQNPVLYFELTDGDVLVMAHIGIITEDEDGVIIMSPHNFTDISNVRPGTTNDSYLRSLTLDKLHEQPNCDIVMVQVQTQVFDGVWPECRHITSNGKHRTYKATITCDGFTAAIPAGAAEKSTLVPYQFTHTGIRFPLDQAPDSYVCSCDNTSG